MLSDAVPILAFLPEDAATKNTPSSAQPLTLQMLLPICILGAPALIGMTSIIHLKPQTLKVPSQTCASPPSVNPHLSSVSLKRVNACGIQL